MNKLTLTATALLTALFPKSQKAVSEGLSTEDFNAFGGELVEVGTRINAQTDGNEKLKADYDAAVKRADEADAALKLAQTQAQTQVTTLQAQLTKAEADRDTYKGHYDAAAAAGKKFPKEDANSRKAELPANDPTQAALNAWKQANPA